MPIDVAKDLPFRFTALHSDPATIRAMQRLNEELDCLLRSLGIAEEQDRPRPVPPK